MQCDIIEFINKFINYFAAKTLHELSLPVEQRIAHVREFLTDIDSTLLYEIVPIQDPFGPTRTDPEIDVSIWHY